MIEKALKYIVGMKDANIHDIGGSTYSDKQLFRVNYNPMAEPIELHTLKGLCEYIRSGVDSLGYVFLHVESPTRVRMFSALDDDRKREAAVVVNADVPHFKFDTYTEHCEFCVALQAKFENTPDRALLLKFAGTVESGSVAEYGDDGVTQKATVKTGIASKSDAIVPNPVTLKAYRTFIEVPQPSAEYIFRMKDDKYSGVMCALFDADGGAWKMKARENIREYLTREMQGIDNVFVIS